MTRVYVGADHRGYRLKEKIKEWLIEWEYEVEDVGNQECDQDDDYVDWAVKLGEKVATNKGMGVLICGSGVGMCVAANKVVGIRAALCTSPRQARLAREDDNANVLCLTADLVDEEINQAITKIFLETVFNCSEKYVRRMEKIKQYESKIS